MPPRRRYVALLAVLHGGLGVLWFAQSPARATSPSFRMLRRLGGNVWPNRPMWLWACLFLIAGLAIGWECWRGARRLIAAVAFGQLVIVTYGTALTLAAVRDPRATYSGAIIYGVLAAWHVTTILHLRSLSRP